MVLGFMRNERPRNCAAVKPAIAWLLQVVHAGPRSAVVHIVACLFQYIRRHSAAGTTATAGDHRLVLGDLLQLALQPIQRDVDGAWHMTASVFISGTDIHDRGAFFDLLREVHLGTTEAEQCLEHDLCCCVLAVQRSGKGKPPSVREVTER